jgi:hypothetical protein
MAVLGEVPNFPTVVAQVPNWHELLWWPSYHLLLRRRRSVVVLLLPLELRMAALELWRSMRLSRGWCVDHVVLLGSTIVTTSGGSWHCPLPFLILGHFIGLHGAHRIDGGTR